MFLDITISDLSGWSYASLVTSILTFLITSFYVYKYRSTKAAVIAGSASISALALLIINVIFFSFANNQDIKIFAIFVLRGINYAFAFHTIFYAFDRIICNGSQNNKLVVYIGYMWMAVTISVSLACTILLDGNAYYDYRVLKDTLNLLLLTVYSIWGFIAVTLLLYFMNKKHLNPKSGSTMLAFIGLTLVAAITSTVLLNIYANDVTGGVSFFLEELTIKAAILIAACYGPTWIQVNSIENNGSKTEIDGDLEANQEPNPNH